MRSKTLILTSLVAFGLTSAAGATTTKPAPAPAKVVKMTAKAEARQDKVQAKAEARQDKVQAKATARKAKLAAARARHANRGSRVAVKSHAKPAATHG